MGSILACVPGAQRRPSGGAPRGARAARRSAGIAASSRAECAPFPEGRMHRVLILGAGKIGALISGLLAESGSYRVQLGDVDGAAAEAVVRAHATGHLAAFTLDATDAGTLARHLEEHP